MKWYRLLALFITFVAALLIGAVVFKYLEETYHPGVPAPETTTTATTTSRPEGDELSVVEDFVSRKNLCVSSEELFELIDAVQQVRSAASINQDFVNNVTENVKNDTRRTPYKIGFFDSFFFCGTIATTIGYGHIYPFTDAGKVFCIAYALVSIPLTLFMLAGIGGKLGNANRWVENRVKRVIRRPYLIRVFMVFFIIIFGLGLFCFVPAYIIMYVEKWSYLDSIYYVFITLSTVGFGDMVVARDPVKEHWAYDILYKIAVLCWIVVGLSFLATIFDLIAEAMRGLKARLEEEMRQVTDFAEKVGHEAKDLAGKVGKVGSEVAHAASMPVKGIKKMAQGEGSKEKLKEKDEKEKGDKEKGDKEKEKDGKKKGKEDKKKKASTPSEEDAIIGTEGSYKRTGSHENLPELPNGPEIPAQSQEVTTDDQNIPQENGIRMGNIPSKEEAETAKQSQEGQPTEPTNQPSSTDETVPPDVKKVAAEEPDVTQEVPDVNREVPKVKPEIPKGKPEVPKGKPEVPKGKPEVKVVMPEVPEVTSVVPEVTPTAPQPVTQSNENAAKPEEPEPAKVEHVDETLGAQEKTTDAEKESAAGKDDTAAGAEAKEIQDSTDKKQEDLDRLI
ncbi:KCNK10 [Branchiostoma lanceolatum]|uniref:KCNK10 protein n=1 Tax=Branchiostoma lanceolatum TaxID=7740 RepID=A0A8J9ZL75_BRALA|nr:KCNK10 [Branchiostoma lanceolatum]